MNADKTLRAIEAYGATAIRQAVLAPHRSGLHEMFRRLPERSWFLPDRPLI
jgi:hypothetical protein